MTRLTRYARTLRHAVRAAQYALADARDRIAGRTSELPAAQRSSFVGNGDFRALGAEMVGHLRRHANLQPQDRVLDVGCGIGRVALPLLDVLMPPGSYDGFDIVPHAIRWCAEHITVRAPHFRFVLADVFNGDYNPRGRQSAARYRFPYENGAFDVVLATSVFTHMPAPDVDNYLREIARVLAPGGRCLVTWFLLNDESKALLRAGKSVLDFRHPVEHGLTIDAHNPARAVAYDEPFVTALYRTCGLSLQPVLRGQWCGRATFVSGQDICIATRG